MTYATPLAPFPNPTHTQSHAPDTTSHWAHSVCLSLSLSLFCLFAVPVCLSIHSFFSVSCLRRYHERNIWSNSWQIKLHWMDQYTALLKTTTCHTTGWLFTATLFKKLPFFQQDIYFRCLPAKINSIEKETNDMIHDIRSISSHLFSFMTSVVEFMIFETTERSTLKLQNTRLSRSITAEHHKPTHHHRWLLLVAGSQWVQTGWSLLKEHALSSRDCGF